MKTQLTITLERVLPHHRAVLLGRPQRSDETVPFIEVNTDDTPDGLQELLVRISEYRGVPETCQGCAAVVHNEWQANRIVLAERPQLGENDNAEQVARGYAEVVCKTYHTARQDFLDLHAVTFDALNAPGAAREWPEFFHRNARVWTGAAREFARAAYEAWDRAHDAYLAEQRMIERQQAEAATASRKAEEAKEEAGWSALVRSAAASVGELARFEAGYLSPKSTEADELVRRYLWPDIPAEISEYRAKIIHEEWCTSPRIHTFLGDSPVSHLSSAQFKALRILEAAFETAELGTAEGTWEVMPVECDKLCRECDRRRTRVVALVRWGGHGRTLKKVYDIGD